MGLRASARQLLKRVIGESSYETLRHTLRVRPDGGLKGGLPPLSVFDQSYHSIA